MTGFRIRTLLCTCALGALLVPSCAQWTSDKPPVLGPGDYPPLATEDNPNPTKPAASGTASGPASGGVATTTPRPLQDEKPTEGTPLPPPDQPISHSATIDVGALGTPEGPPVGTLYPSNGGFSDSFWSGSDRLRIEQLLARAPIVSADPVLRNLARRIVLTKASAPPGAAPKALLTLRLQRLLDAGLVDEAGALAATASLPDDAEFARVQADAILLANRAPDACGPATATRQTSADVFWMQLRAYCATLSGDTASAELTQQVLQAQGHNDPAYDTLVQDILDKKSLRPGAIAEPTALHIFLLQQAGLPVTEAVARNMGTPENLLVALDHRNPPRARFEAAERIVATGALSPAQLKQIADAQDLPLSKVADAVGDAPNLPFFMGQVLLHRGASIEPRPEQKARIVEQALALGEKFKMAPLAAALQADVISSIKPASVEPVHARNFARALLLAGHAEQAAAWTRNDPLMRTIVAIASRDPAKMAVAQADMSSFAVGLAKNPPDPDSDRSYKALVLGLADVMDATMPADAKSGAVSVESQIWGGVRPGPGQMRTIQEVSESPTRRGEALLLILDAVHDLGLRDMAPDVTIEFVRLLISMNETGSARALAIEALAQYQPPPLPIASAQAASAP